VRSATLARRRTVHVSGAQPYGHFADHRAACPGGPTVTSRNKSGVERVFSVQMLTDGELRCASTPGSRSFPELSRACKAAQEHDEPQGCAVESRFTSLLSDVS
jgi:hypothetical protein